MEALFETIRECWVSIHHGDWLELGAWSYILLALLVATEGPVSTLLGAAAAATGILDIRYVYLGAFVGNVAGDCLWYSVGYVNKLSRIHRIGRWIGLREHHLDRLETEMHIHATKLIAVSKLAIGLIIPTLIAAGLARVPWRRWFPLVLSIEVVWTILMVNLGFYGAGWVTQMEHGIQLIGIVFLLLIGFGIFWFGGKIFQNNTRPTEQSVPLTAAAPKPYEGSARLVNVAGASAQKLSKSIATKSAMTQAIVRESVSHSFAAANRPSHQEGKQIQVDFAGD